MQLKNFESGSTLDMHTNHIAHRAAATLAPAALPSAMDPNRSATTPCESKQCQAPGFALTEAASLVWGADMAPMEKLRDGRSTGLGQPQINEDTEQSTEL